MATASIQEIGRGGFTWQPYRYTHTYTHTATHTQNRPRSSSAVRRHRRAQRDGIQYKPKLVDKVINSLHDLRAASTLPEDNRHLGSAQTFISLARNFPFSLFDIYIATFTPLSHEFLFIAGAAEHVALQHLHRRAQTRRIRALRSTPGQCHPC